MGLGPVLTKQDLIEGLKAFLAALEGEPEVENVDVDELERRLRLLEKVRQVNDEEQRGIKQHEMSVLATKVGYDSRGTAGLYRAGLLVWNGKGSSSTNKSYGPERWITKAGRRYLANHDR
jgi:hypothetical protein